MSTHVYEALEGPEHIRLIALHPAFSKDAPLRINFLSSTIEDLEGRYDAISYTWGEPILTFALFVDDDTQVCVTENLDRALRYLRYKDRDRLLWADAACINQADNEEKAVQIPFMVDIFRGARKVMAWLDPGGDTTVEQRGMRTIDHLSRTSRIAMGQLHEHSREVLQFVNLPWFNRLWIIQEIVFSLEIYLICGKTALPFSRLIAALTVMKPPYFLYSPNDRARVEAILEIGKLWDRYSLFGERLNERERRDRRSYGRGDPTDIILLIEKFGSYGCTDPRDRIFALCSMATNVRPIGYSWETDDDYFSGTDDDRFSKTDEDLRMPPETDEDLRWPRYHAIGINIDYSLDVMETYETFALACLIKPVKAGLIWRALLSRQYSPRPINWPSWVPDWRLAPRVAGLIPSFGWVDFRLKLRRIAIGILRMTLPVTRFFLDGKEKQLYTVKFKTSRETKDSGMSFDSQLLQLYKMLQKPETVQESHQLLIGSESTPRKLIPMNLPNLLVDMIRKHVPLYNFDDVYADDEEIFLELERYFARMSMASEVDDLQGSPRPSSVYIRGFINELEQALGNTNNLFCFHGPGTEANSVGYGNVALELGDQLLPLDSSPHILNHGEVETEAVLILRPVYSIEEPDGEKPVYRLVGSGYIFDPTTVLMGMEHKKHLKEISETDPEAENHKSWDEKEKEEKAFFSSFGCQTFEQVVYLA